MAYKVLDILKDLPGTNCRECGKTGCFAFATGVYLDGAPLAGCPHLAPEKLAAMEAKLSEGRAAGGAKKDASHVQALVFLKKKIAEMDFRAMAGNCGAEYLPGPPEALALELFGKRHIVAADDVKAVDGVDPTVWVKVFLYIYVTRASGAAAGNRWIAYRELPNTVSKEKTYEKTASEIADHFGNDSDAIDRAARALGGERREFGSTDGAWFFKALPRVPILLLYWKGGEEFGARTSVLLDAGVLDYLDQEAIVFMCEAFVKLMTGGDVSAIIP